MNKQDGTKLALVASFLRDSFFFFFKEPNFAGRVMCMCVSVTLPAYDAHPLDSWHQQRLEAFSQHEPRNIWGSRASSSSSPENP